MDADTRHSLKQNELAEALSKIDFHDKRLLSWLGVIVLVAVVYGGVKVWGWQSRRAADADWDTLAMIAPASANLGDAPIDQLRGLVSSNSGPSAEAIARLRLVRHLWSRAHGAVGPWTEEAMRELQAVRNSPDVPAPLRAAALFMTGKLHETQREFDQAARCYGELKSSSEFAGSPFVQMAELRAEGLGELRETVVFQPGLAPLVLPQAPPASAPAPEVGAPSDSQPAESAPSESGAPGSAPVEESSTESP